MKYKIIGYESMYDREIEFLEKSIVQGKAIQLEIVKEHFLSRAKPFREFIASLAINEQGKVVGTSIGAKTKIKINEKIYDTSVGFDVKVSKEDRNRGVGRLLTKDGKTQILKQYGIDKNFVTLKKSNSAVIKLTLAAIKKTFLYEFIYLTIPVKQKIIIPNELNHANQLFSVYLFDREEVVNSLFFRTKSGLAYFQTQKLYKLKIKKIHWLYKLGLRIYSMVFPKKSTFFPVENKAFGFATLYNYSPQNIRNINEILERVSAIGIDYLQVCCRKDDFLYPLMKPYAISTYPYYILSDFPLVETDSVGIDVRCL
ncbi:hypothetical protein [Aquiflexum sp.]|uniref:hypothetical protein n=1 Tax=Aquiflexum sp. TaxID=1872584 RepID=UPI00359356A8